MMKCRIWFTETHSNELERKVSYFLERKSDTKFEGRYYRKGGP